MQMADTDNINAEIQQSLENFTRHFEAFISNQFNEMRSCGFFDAVPDEFLANLVNVTNMITFDAGDTIISENDAMGSFYVVLFGSASVYVKQKKVGNILRGECIGEGAFFAKHQKRSASVKADGKVIVLEITKQNIDAIDRETQKHLNKALLQAMINKLQAANATIVSLMAKRERANGLRSIDLSLHDA